LGGSEDNRLAEKPKRSLPLGGRGATTSRRPGSSEKGGQKNGSWRKQELKKQAPKRGKRSSLETKDVSGIKAAGVS